MSQAHERRTCRVTKMCSKSLLLFFLICLFSEFTHGQTNETHLQEDYDCIEALGSYYKFHRTPKNWHNAKRVCSDEGAILFYPGNSVEANAVISFWKGRENSSQPHETWLYVGMSDIVTEGVYATVDGKSISEVYSNWMKGQPDNSFDEDCIHMNQEGLINDINCKYVYGFICKKSLPSLKQNCKTKQVNRSGQRDEKFFRKDYTYIESVESFYKIHTMEMTFTDAKRMCAQEGVILFYAENVEEFNAVASFWNRTQPRLPSVFVGLTDQMAEGLFETVDGRPIFDVYSKWEFFQPNNFRDNQDCVLMALTGTMRSCECDSKAKFICKKSLQSLAWNHNCNMPNLDYIYNKDIGKCYKLHTTPMNWTDAYAMCRIELTSLAMVSNRMEADYLVTLTESTIKPRVPEKYQKGLYHVGFHNRFNEGWQTVAGTPMNVDPDIWFDGYQPDKNGYEECSSMFFNGRLINTSCNMKSLFICEQKIIPTSNMTTDQNEENYIVN